jgi:hypothetical protein
VAGSERSSPRACLSARRARSPCGPPGSVRSLRREEAVEDFSSQALLDGERPLDPEPLGEVREYRPRSDGRAEDEKPGRRAGEPHVLDDGGVDHGRKSEGLHYETERTKQPHQSRHVYMATTVSVQPLAQEAFGFLACLLGSVVFGEWRV